MVRIRGNDGELTFDGQFFITLACSMNIEEGVHLVEIRKGVGISI